MSVASPVTLSQALQGVASALQRGDMAGAERWCRTALGLNAACFDALNTLGAIAGSAGRIEEAAELLARAVSVNPRSSDTFSNLAVMQAALNRHTEALESCNRAIALRSGFAEAHFNRGVALAGLGRYDEALASYDRAAGLRPEDARFHNNRGNVLHALRRHADALAAYERALALQPGYADALVNRGMALRDLGRHVEALESCERAVALDPRYAGAQNNRGVMLEALCRFDEALGCYDQAVALQPGYAEAHYNRGSALRSLHRPREALASYERALLLRADYADAWDASGYVMRDLFRSDEALATHARALQIDPGHVGALHASANALREAKRYDEALSYYDRALDGSPERDYLRGDRLHAWMHVCHWDGLREELATLAERVSRGERASVPGAAIGVFDDPALQKRIAQTWIADKFANAVTAADMPAYARNAKIRVGYFSADFYDHATMYLMAELFERHDRARFEFTAFSFGPDRDDDMRRRAVAAFDRFIDVRERSDLEIALLARELEIDIAVDLKGHTQDSRAGVFARRAAPIQVNYLGYPGTMGADFIDYLIADSSLVADGDEQHYVERIALLPDSYQPNGRLRGNAEREFTRGELGLPAAGFVYCCFNATYKITPETFDSWMRILGRIDGSVL